MTGLFLPPTRRVAGQFASARLIEVVPKASISCSDLDDQKFIDLAVAHRALLLSKDQHVLCMKKRLLTHGIRAQAAM